jgi:hypothetical protein
MYKVNIKEISTGAMSQEPYIRNIVFPIAKSHVKFIIQEQNHNSTVQINETRWSIS